MTAPDASAQEDFDRALRAVRAAQRKTARGEGGPTTALTEGRHRAVCEALLDQVDEARRERYRRAVS